MTRSHAGPDAAATARFRIRSLVWSVYAPSFLLSLGQGILIPVLPLFARDELGSTDLMIGLAVAARHIGAMGFDVPAGIFVSRFGMKRTMILGVALFGVAAVWAGLSPNLATLFTARLAAGAAFAFWSISRHSYIAVTVPVASRGRALSLFGGLSRVATVMGPLLGGLLAEFVDIRAPFFAQAIVAAMTLSLVLFTVPRHALPPVTKHNILPTLARTVSVHRMDFATAGVAAIMLQFLRASREFIIPLAGDDIGLSESQIGYVTTVSFAVDSSLFLPVGVIMDKWGRKFTGVPSFLALGGSLALVPLADGLGGLMLVGALAGLGNGLSTAFVLTLGTDLAPRENTGEFLGVWRLISDSGGAAGPLAIGAVAQAATLGTASVVAGGVGGLGAIVLILFVKETLVRRPSARVTRAPPVKSPESKQPPD